MKKKLRRKSGFTLLEAVLIMVIMAATFLAFGYLYGNIDQTALKADLTIVATKLAKEKLEEVIQTKADSGYAAVVSQAPASATAGSWSFTRAVTVTNVEPVNFNTSIPDTGYKKVDVTVSWGVGAANSIALTTLVTNMVPSSVVGPGYPTCP